MQLISTSQLERVTGGATHDSSGWLSHVGGQAAPRKITAPDMRAIPQPNTQFRAPNMNASPPDQSWQKRVPGMFRAMGM